MLGDADSKLLDDKPEIWNEYRKRYKDVSTDVRRICVKDSLNIMMNHAELRGDLAGFFLESLFRELLLVSCRIDG